MRRSPWRSLTCGAVWLLAPIDAPAQVPEQRAQLEDSESSRREPPQEAPAEAPRNTAPTPEDDATQRKVTLPVPLSTEVPYPDEASGDADVALELLVGPDGTVTEARVIEGTEPFASHAIAAARSFTFQPAMVAGKVVPARIRFLVRFEAAVPEDTAPSDASQPPSSPTGSPSAIAKTANPQPTEYTVLVRGERQSPGAVKVTVAESAALPGAFGDPFRSIEMLPGVTPVVSGVPFFFVRGAPPGNMGFYLDGVPVPLLYHAFIGPAVVHPKLIDSVQIYRGGYPARFGRFAGGIVSADLRGPPSEFGGQASIRLVDSGAFVASPFADQRGYASVSGRYSYTALILSLLTDAILEYWDYQARLSYDVSSKDTLSVFGFGAYDFISDDEGESFAGTEFHRVDLRYDHRFTEDTRLRLALTGGVDGSRATNGDILDRSLRLRSEVSHRASDELSIRTGADVAVDRFRLAVDRTLLQARDIEELFPPRDDLVFGGYLEATWNPEPFVQVEPGVRFDVFRSTGNTAVAVDPRLSATFNVASDWRLIHTLGIAHQTPNFVPSLPGARVGGLRGGLQRAVQSSAGVEHDVLPDTTASVTLFHSLFFNLSDPLGFSRTISADVDASDVRALGYAAGLELMVHRPLTRKLGGFLSYTLSRSVRSNGRVNSLSAFDRTHVGSVALTYDLGKNYRIGGRALVTTGVPTRTLTVDGPRFAGNNRPSPFFRLDLRAEKRWMLGETSWWAVNAEILNATASQEIVGRSCNPIRCTDSVVGPLVLPSIGAEVAF